MESVDETRTKLIKELINIDDDDDDDHTDYNQPNCESTTAAAVASQWQHRPSQLIDENQEPPLMPTTTTTRAAPSSASPSVFNHHQSQMPVPSTRSVALLPYNSLFVTSNELDIGIIMKNLESIIYEKNAHHDKTAKVCNFEIKSK